MGTASNKDMDAAGRPVRKKAPDAKADNLGLDLDIPGAAEDDTE